MGRKFGRKDLIWMLLAVLTACGICFFQMDGFHINWNGMTGFSSDGMLGMALNQSVREEGLRGFFFNSRLGAPDSSALIDTPFMDPAYGFVMFILSLILPSASAMEYGMILITFAGIAVTMFFVVRIFTADYVLMYVFSVLAAVTPYHMMRGIGHLSLSNYWNVPLGVLLAVYIALMHDSKFDPKDKIVYIMAVLTGLGNVYYSFFCLLIMMVGEVCQFISVRNRHNLLKGIRLIIVTICAFLAGIAPKVWYGITAGENVIAGIRYPVETETYGMKLVQLLLPPAYSLWGRATRVYNFLFSTNENGMSSMGIAAVIGFFALVIFMLVRMLTDYRGGKVLAVLAVDALGLLIWCTIGGFSSLFSMIFSPEIRATNRASIVIVIICLLALAVILDYVLHRAFPWLKRGACYIIAAFLLLIGTFEACYGTRIALYSDGMQEMHEEFSSFYKEVEALLPEGAMVYQLPFVLFPESAAVNDLQDYEEFEGYLYTDTLRWSYGGMRGRNTAAQELYAADGQSKTFIRNILEAGFDGVVIYTEAYEDGAESIRRFYEEDLGLSPVISGNGRRVFYDISGLNTAEMTESYQPGQRLMFYGDDPAASLYVSKGLSHIEKNFTWTEGHEFCIRMKINSHDDFKGQGTLHIKGTYGGSQRVELSVNEIPVLDTVVDNEEMDLDFSFPIPDDGVIEIRLALPDAVAPASVDSSSTDYRLLALKLMDVVIE